MDATQALRLEGTLAAAPEPISDGETIVFLRTGDEDTIPQEVFCHGRAAAAAERCSEGDRVLLDCDLIGPVWRALQLELRLGLTGVVASA